jgi:hypothetical protein
MQEFQRALDPINAIAASTPGFLWMYTDDWTASSSHGKENDIPVELRQDPLLMPQLSVWRDADSLLHFVFKSGHAVYYKRKREWFQPMIESPCAVCWWHMHDTVDTAVGNIDPAPPTLEESFERLRALSENGGEPSEFAFDIKSAKAGKFPPPFR